VLDGLGEEHALRVMRVLKELVTGRGTPGLASENACVSPHLRKPKTIFIASKLKAVVDETDATIFLGSASDMIGSKSVTPTAAAATATYGPDASLLAAGGAVALAASPASATSVSSSHDASSLESKRDFEGTTDDATVGTLCRPPGWGLGL
jgi:hypothetical protein